MNNPLMKYYTLFQSMGLSYFIYRGWYTIYKSSGLLRMSEGISSKNKYTFSKAEWKTSASKFFFNSRSVFIKDKLQDKELEKEIKLLQSGAFKYFNGPFIQDSASNKWLTHPIDGHIYDTHVHWTRFNDFSEGRDIKYIWERSRFCYLFTFLRYDCHYNTDSSEYVIGEIISWIDSNPLEYGPHYISSQEIALRVINWLFAVYFYADSDVLDDTRFHKIMHSIYAQLQHIYSNLGFSQHLVRNNHILSEASALYFFSILFPQTPSSKKWLQRSRTIILSEVQYQIFQDGTYLQYSMNYHRVVIQLLTLIIGISKINSIQLPDSLFDRAKSSLQFLVACTHSDTGQLPNYGHNDGSLFFPLNGNSFQDFRPQLQVLGHLCGQGYFSEHFFEDNYWFGISSHKPDIVDAKSPVGKLLYGDSGYFLFRENNFLTFVRCGSHISRPAHADNLHVDIWHGAKNIMRDGGTFTYNGDNNMIRYFFGTASHNTILLGENDQMLKGPRFIWYYWTRQKQADMEETDKHFSFTGSVLAFRQTGSWKIHSRTIQKTKELPIWVITDTINKTDGLPLHQIWNPCPEFETSYHITAIDRNGNAITPSIAEGFYSKSYGSIEKSPRILFSTSTDQITTTITAK